MSNEYQNIRSLAGDQLPDNIDFPSIEKALEEILIAIGENPQRKGLLKTPERVAKMYSELFAGYREDPAAMVNDALFEVTYDEMVIVRDIEFYSMCEHHLLPFLGRAHIAYFPKGLVIGLSKIPRIVDLFARRLQVQERMTRQIADFINGLLHPNGVAVVVEGLHLCTMMRGVKKHKIGEFYGTSYFCDPRGQVLAEPPRDKDAVVVADLDLDVIEEVRNVWQFFRDRRPDAYGGLVAP